MTVGSLFSGIGGLDLGLEWAGFETKWFCEIEPFPQKVLKKHWPHVPIIEDVRDVKPSEPVQRVDVIAGGFPCQDISWAGKGRGIDYDLSEKEGTRSGLWWEMWRVIRDFRPRYVVAENVPALTHRGLDIVLGSLAEIGYDAEWQTISAAGVGAPHIRERVFIVAYPEHDGFLKAEGEHRGDKQDKGREAESERCKQSARGHNRSALQPLVAHPNTSGREAGGSAESDEPVVPVSDCYTGSHTTADVAHSHNPRLEGREGVRERGGQRTAREGGSQPDWFGGPIGQPWPVSFKLGDTQGESGNGSGLHRVNGCKTQESEPGNTGSPKDGWMEVEYDFRGVAYGVSDRVGALKGYGNAVVPQVGYLVGRAIMEREKELGRL